MPLKDELTLPTKLDAIAVRPESLPVPTGKTERRELRTPTGKTFVHAEKAPDGKEIRTCQTQLGAICYRDDDGQLRSIDTTIRDLGDRIGVEWAPYKFDLHESGIGFDFFSRDGGWVGITLSGIGGEKFDQDTPLKPDIIDNTITFRDVRPGCDIVFKCLNQRVKTLRILHDENAPRTFDWTVASDKPELIDSALFGTDAAGNQLELFGAIDGDVIIETWNGITQNDAEVVYPVEIDPTVTVNPGVNGDDGREKISLGWNPNSIIMGSSLGDGFNPGLRFPNVTVDQGTTITTATLDLVAKTINEAGGSGTIYGWAADNPVAYGTDLPSSVPKTSASVATGTINTTGAKSFAITTIVQELLNRGGFASGNAIALAIIGTVSSSNYVIFYDTVDGSNYPALSITYTAAAGGTAANLLLLGCG